MQQPYVVMAARQVRDDCRSLILALIIEHENFTARIVLTCERFDTFRNRARLITRGHEHGDEWLLSPVFLG